MSDVTTEDGVVHHFPDEATPAMIKVALARYLKPETPKPSMMQRAGDMFMGAARDVNSQLPLIGGTAGAALGLPALAAGQVEVPVGGAMMGAAAGKSIQQMLNPLLGQGDVPTTPGQVGQGLLGQAQEASVQGLTEGVPSQVIAPAIKSAGNKLMQASIEHGFGDPVQIGQTLLDNGIKNSKAGYLQIKALTSKLSQQHWAELARRSSDPKGVRFDAAKDYMGPALSELKDNAKMTNLPGPVMRRLNQIEGEFLRAHSVASPREGARRLPSDFKPHALSLFELNAMKEDADAQIRKIFWQRQRAVSEVPPTMEVDDVAYQKLAGRARDLLYGPMDETGTRVGGPLADLYPLEQKQSRLLAARDAIGPQARKAISKGALAVKSAAGAAPAMGAAMMMHANPVAVGGAGLLGGVMGPALSNPETLSTLALATQNQNIAPMLSNLIRSIQGAMTGSQQQPR